MKRLALLVILATSVALSAQGRRGADWLLIARHPDTNTYCSYVVSPTSISAASTLTTTTLTITTTAGCAWTSVSNDSFITITSGASGTGSGSSGVSIAANTGAARAGSISIAGTTVAVSQAAPGGSTCVGATSAAVVPCGFGFGMSTRAAYGAAPTTQPTILRVTNLNDSGAGSLRAALTTSGPRVVVFETSGMITLTTDITITSPYITIAGQTAPSPGITIRGRTDTGGSAADYDGGLISVATHDVLMQHLRVRAGDGGVATPETNGHNGIQIYGGDVGPANVYNVVIDHCSVSWAGGKNIITLSTATNGGLTIWRSITSEALFAARNIIHASDQPTGLGMLIAQKYYGGTTNLQASVIQTAFIFNSDRNPEVQGNLQLQFLNNLLYGWGYDNQGGGYPWALFLYWQSPDIYPVTVSAVGNKFIAGNTASPVVPLYAFGSWNPQTGIFYLNDNARNNGSLPQTVNEYSANLYHSITCTTSPVACGTPALPAGYTPIASSAVESTIINTIGARPLDRDAVDIRVVGNLTNRTGGSQPIASQSAVGGWPTLAVNTQAFTAPASPNTVTASGYTNLELTLQAAAAAIESP